MRTIRPKIHFIYLYFMMLAINSQAQPYDLLIRGGHIIDPASGVDGVRDVAVRAGRIARVAENIAAKEANKVIDAKGFYVAPGFIDMHTHVFVGPQAGLFANGVNSVSPDDFTFRAGVTTVVDAGTSGYKSFPLFKKQVIDQSKTRILAFLNIYSGGMTGAATEQNLDEMRVDSTIIVASQHSEIVGIKIGHYAGRDWTPFDRAVLAAEGARKPLFVECHLPGYSLENQLARMRPGDIITHSFEHISERMPIADEKGKLRPFVLTARRRGVLFDLGHGGAGFWFDQAVPAAREQFFPDSFGSDLHRFSMNSAMKDMANIMSKFMALGMTLQLAVRTATWNAANALHREDLGNLKEGAVADIAMFGVREGSFGFVDSGGNLIQGKNKIEVEMTIRDGRIVWDLNGLGAGNHGSPK